MVVSIIVDLEFLEFFMKLFKCYWWVKEKYICWVKIQLCVCCGMLVDDLYYLIGYGQGGMGIKVYDFFVLFLCRKYYDELYMDIVVFEEKYGF